MAYIHYLVLALAVLTLGPTLCAGSLHPPHTQHHLARTNAEAFASGQRVLPPSSFALRQDPSGRSRMLPGTKTRGRCNPPLMPPVVCASTDRILSQACASFGQELRCALRVRPSSACESDVDGCGSNVQARVTVTSASGAFLGYLATSPSGSGYVITNSLSVALVVKLQATVPNMPYVLVDVRHSKFIGASQLGNPLAVAKGSAGYALLYQTSPSGTSPLLEGFSDELLQRLNSNDHNHDVRRSFSHDPEPSPAYHPSVHLARLVSLRRLHPHRHLSLPHRDPRRS